LNNSEKIIIIGAGIAGTTAAKSLRDEGFQGELTLIDANESFPFDRPPLSKKYLSDDLEKDELMLEEETFYQEKKIKLLLNRNVINFDLKKKSVMDQKGESHYFDKLLIATGSKLKKLDYIKGFNLKGIHYLKTLLHANQLKESIKSAHKFVIIGGGFIGLEVAASLTEMGKKVTIIESNKYPLTRLFGEEIGKHIKKIHSDKGIELLTNRRVDEFIGDTNIKYVLTNKGEKIYCDEVLVSVGVLPNTDVFEDTLESDNGILVNEYCETSQPDVFAVGDCAKWPYGIDKEMIRVEHWDHAKNQGRTAALNMLNPKSSNYDTIPYFWSDQLHLYIQYLGHHSSWDNKILRGDIKSNQFTIFYLLKDKVVAALIVNDPKNVLPARKLISKGIKINAEELSNQDIKLKKIIKNKVL